MSDIGRTKQNIGKTAAIAAAVVMAAGGGLLLGRTHEVQAAPVSTGWQMYKDAPLGFTVARPAGWTVRADAHSIVVQNPVRSETVLMETFTAEPGESAEAHLNRLPEERAALFANAQISDVTPQASKGDEVAATLAYGSGAGRGRVLCSITQGKGLLFVLAAPGTGFASDQPVLMRIVKSLRFMVPAGSSAGAKNVSAGAVRALHFVPWTEPREHGFTVDVPQGWKAEGGVFHTGPADLRIAYAVTAPGKDMQVVIGDPRLPGTLITPNAMLGAFDGQNGCLHYMPAGEFNHWYLDNFGRQAMDNLVIGTDHDLPDISRQRTLAAQQMFGGSAEVTVSVGVTEFSGLSKTTHQQITGALISSTQRMTSRGFGAPTTMWAPTLTMLTCNDDAAKTRNQQIVMAVFTKLQQTYHEDPAWVNRLSREGAASGEQKRQELAQNTKQMIAQSQERSAQITRNSDAARDASMGAYWGHVNAQSEQQRGFVNYMGDRSDVTDGSGKSYNVQGGSKHYYQNGQTGDILGTDSAYSPGVDFTPLTER